MAEELGGSRERCYSIPEMTNEVRKEGLDVEEILEQWGDGLMSSDFIGAERSAATGMLPLGKIEVSHQSKGL